MPTRSVSVDDFRKGRVPREVRVRQLLDLAEELFLEHGFDGFSIEELCRAAGVSRPVVYEHFGSKDGIFLACQRRIRDEFEEALVAGLEVTEVGAAVREVSEAYFGIIEANPKRWLFVFGSTTGFVGPLAETLYELRAETVGRIAQLCLALRPDLGERQAAALAHALSGAGEGLGRWWMHEPAMSRAEVVDFNVSVAVAAIRDFPAS